MHFIRYRLDGVYASLQRVSLTAACGLDALSQHALKILSLVGGCALEREIESTHRENTTFSWCKSAREPLSGRQKLVWVAIGLAIVCLLFPYEARRRGWLRCCVKTLNLK